MLQTSFPELKKHGPTNLYMLYPMAQSVVLVCVEIDKKMPPQWHCPLSSTFSLLAHTPACQQEALPARYRRTASISTCPHMKIISSKMTMDSRCCVLKWQ
jgi:hypothetical protein